LKKLPAEFYERADVVRIARELLGKIIVTRIEGKTTKARIVETEAYIGITDMASHSRNGTRTPRNDHMYAQAGTAYVYICYGMHHLFNVVTNKKDVPDAVLIRAAEPLAGIDSMLQRTGKKLLDHTLTKGPGNLGRALGINKLHSGLSLFGNTVYLAEDDFSYPPSSIGISKRIGVESAGKDAHNPFRFYIRGNKFVSGSPVR
jgi:DNA-3-methyladenine glycosylase